MIGGVTQVVIEVEDQDRAKVFWTETLGFELVQDAPYGAERWLEARTPDKAVIVVLNLRKGPRPAARPGPADLERVLLRRGPAADLSGTERPRGQLPAAAGRAAFRLVVAVRGPGRQPVRPRSPRPVAPLLVQRKGEYESWLVMTKSVATV